LSQHFLQQDEARQETGKSKGYGDDDAQNGRQDDDKANGKAKQKKKVVGAKNGNVKETA